MVSSLGGTFPVGRAGLKTPDLARGEVNRAPYLLDKHEMRAASSRRRSATSSASEVAKAMSAPRATRRLRRRGSSTGATPTRRARRSASGCRRTAKSRPRAATTPQDRAKARLAGHDSVAALNAPSSDCSPAGLCDMLGLLSEWTSTRRRPGTMVLRGASFLVKPGGLLDTIHQRFFAKLAESDESYGFRCALTKEP